MLAVLSTFKAEHSGEKGKRVEQFMHCKISGGDLVKALQDHMAGLQHAVSKMNRKKILCKHDHFEECWASQRDVEVTPRL